MWKKWNNKNYENKNLWKKNFWKILSFPDPFMNFFEFSDSSDHFE